MRIFEPVARCGMCAREHVGYCWLWQSECGRVGLSLCSVCNGEAQARLLAHIKEDGPRAIRPDTARCPGCQSDPSKDFATYHTFVARSGLCRECHAAHHPHPETSPERPMDLATAAKVGRDRALAAWKARRATETDFEQCERVLIDRLAALMPFLSGRLSTRADRAGLGRPDKGHRKKLNARGRRRFARQSSRVRASFGISNADAESLRDAFAKLLKRKGVLGTAVHLGTRSKFYGKLPSKP